MKPRLPETSDLYSFDYQEVISRISEIFSMVIGMNDPKPVYDYILKSMDDLFGFTEIFLNLLTEGGGHKIISAYGFDSESEKTIFNTQFPDDWNKWETQEQFRVTKNGFLIDGEKWADFVKSNPKYDNMSIYDNLDRLYEPREFPEQWHEGDFFEFIIRDPKGAIIGYIEIGDSRTPELLPHRSLIEALDTFSQIIGIVNRIDSQIKVEKKKQESASLLATLLGKDLKPKLADSLVSLSKMETQAGRLGEVEQNVAKSLKLLDYSIRTLNAAKQIIEIENRPYSLLAMTSIPHQLQRWSASISTGAKKIKADLKVDKGKYFAKVDGRFPELMTSILELINSQTESEIGQLKIQLSNADEQSKMLKISVTSNDLAEREWRKMRNLFTNKPSSRMFYQSGILPMFIINRIISDYGGTTLYEWKENTGWIGLTLPLV